MIDFDKLGQALGRAQGGQGAPVTGAAHPGTAQPSAHPAAAHSAAVLTAARRFAPGALVSQGPASLRGPLAGALAALVLLAPLPMGANRPLFWALIALAVGVIGLAHLLGLLADRRRGGLRLGGLWLALGLAALQPLWGVVQALPLGQWPGGAWVGALALPLPPDLAQGADALGLRAATISVDPGATLAAVLRMAARLGFFLLALDALTRPERIGQMMKITFFGITFYAVWGMVSLVMLNDAAPWGVKTAYLGMATGPFVNRNSFAAFLGLGLVLGVALLAELRARPRMRRPRRHGPFTERGLSALAIGVALALIGVALLATQSRMGLVASVAGAGVCAVLARGWVAGPKRGLWRAGLMLAGLAGLAVGVLLVGGQGLFERTLFARVDFGVRQDIFSTALALIAARPLAGFGLDAFALAFEAMRPDAFWSELIFTDAHSTYLENWAEGGLVFGSMPLVAGALVVARLGAVWRAGGAQRGAAAAALGAIVLAALHSTLDFPFEIEANVLMALWIVAMGCAPQRGQQGARQGTQLGGGAGQTAPRTAPDPRGRA